MAGRSCAILLLAAVAQAQDIADMLDRTVRAAMPPGVLRSAIGVTRQGTPIPCLFTADDLDYKSTKTRVLLVGGLDGSQSSADSVLAAIRWFYTDGGTRKLREDLALSAVPVANPDGWAMGTGMTNSSGAKPAYGFPPKGEAYGGDNPEAAYLWRWIGMHAPDLVVEVRSDGVLGWNIPDSLPSLRSLRPTHGLPASEELAPQLVAAPVAGAGTIPALQAEIGSSWQLGFAKDLVNALKKSKFEGPSPARAELARRAGRSPAEVARQLAAVYGRAMDDVVYIPAMAMVGRLWLGELQHDTQTVAEIEKLVAPWYGGSKAPLEKPTASHLAGHLVFGELARATSKPHYIELARAAADLAFDEKGAPKPSVPMHNEMSDAVFMGCPILAQAGRLTGDAKYFDMCVRHLKFMIGLDLRPDGLYRHSPLDSTAWGRGNGFPALGLALALSDFPAEHPARAELLNAFRSHLAALVKHQDVTGAWHQVIDHPESYRELTATSMIAFAMARGIRLGWLDKSAYELALARAWTAVAVRVAPDGALVDVCAGTGKQKSLRDYLDRPAILGQDARGGAMALLLATEMMRTGR